MPRRLRYSDIAHLPSLKRRLYEIIIEQKRSLQKLSIEVGLGDNLLSKWQKGNPTVANFQAVLNYLGYDLEVVDLHTRVPYRPLEHRNGQPTKVTAHNGTPHQDGAGGRRASNGAGPVGYAGKASKGNSGGADRAGSPVGMGE